MFEIDPLSPRAIEITLESVAVVCDVLLLALAEETGTVVVATDHKLLEALEDTPYVHFGHPLTDAANLIPSMG